MPAVNEDELDFRIHSSSHNTDDHTIRLSKAEQRKNNKPIIEKRRRARINQCLNELKDLILDATNKDPAHHTKLEKADILEMTVKYLQSVHRQHLSSAIATDSTIVREFRTGFDECATEVSQYISSLDSIDEGVRKRLISHLSNCIISGARTSTVTSSLVDTADDSPPSTAIRLQHVPKLQLIPSRLPSGELVLLLPNASSLHSLFPNTSDLLKESKTSAFIPVSKNDELLTPSTFPPHVDSGDDTRVIHENSRFEVSSTSNDGLSFKTPLISAKYSSSSNASSSYLTSLVERHAFKPLTIHADPCNEFKNTLPEDIRPLHKSPLDFSVKKESAKTFSSTDRSSRKRPLEDIPCNVQMSSKFAKANFKRDDNSAVEDPDMWRPW